MFARHLITLIGTLAVVFTFLMPAAAEASDSAISKPLSVPKWVDIDSPSTSIILLFHLNVKVDVTVTKGNFIITNNTCATMVDPYSSCRVDVALKPNTVVKDGELGLYYRRTSQHMPTYMRRDSIPLYVNLFRSVMPSQAQIQFGEQQLNTSGAAKSITLSFQPVNDVAVRASGDFILTSNSCIPTVAWQTQSHTCEVSVAFKPSAVGERTGGIAVNGQHVVDLLGTGILQQ
jgi:hypothetical protein